MRVYAYGPLMCALSELFAAVADETRLRMLALLLDGAELCVCDVMAALEITQSRASRHLRILRAAGLLADRRDAAWVHYRLVPSPEAPQRAVLAALRRSLPEDAAAADRRRLAAQLGQIPGRPPRSPRERRRATTRDAR